MEIKDRLSTNFGRLLAEVMHSMQSGTPKEQLIATMNIYEYHMKLKSRIAELEAKLRWISVKVMTPDSSRLPKRYDVVITSRPHVETAYYKNHKWFVYEGGNKVDITNLVTHWKERPLPPEEYQHDPA